MSYNFPRFYPVLPDVAFIERLAPTGIEIVQLRLKDASEAEIERQIAGALKICGTHNVQLIVNDYWQAAIRLGADYIHLGQEDLADADLSAIRAAGIKIGVSTHSLEELDIALQAKPDYVALGPVYETILKKMKWAPQGLEKLGQWRAKINVPLVAIGGITPARAPGVFEAGADSVAVVTDLVMAENPVEQARLWVDLYQPQGNS